MLPESREERGRVRERRLWIRRGNLLQLVGVTLTGVGSKMRKGWSVCAGLDVPLRVCSFDVLHVLLFHARSRFAPQAVVWWAR